MRTALLTTLVLAGCQIENNPQTIPSYIPPTTIVDTAVPPQAEPIALCINEIMPRNTGALEVEGDWPDWFEIHNPTAADVSLNNWYIEDGNGNFQLMDASVVAPAGGFLLIYADGLSAGPHTSFLLDSDGDSLTLTNTEGAATTVEFPPAAADYSFARTGDCCPDAACWESVLWGTPGLSNTTPLP